MNLIKELGFDIFQLDLCENEVSEKTASYIIKGENTVIIETGASPSNKRIQDGLKTLGIAPEEVMGIVVSHIHLDHAGGAGLLMSQCPNAKLYVHEKGKKHLVNPERLIESSKQVYGELYEPYFDPILPIAEDRVVVVGAGDEILIEEGRALNVFDSPGHALHHIFVYDSKSNGIFSGDAAGLFYRPIFEQHGVPFSFPATTPTQFDPVAMKETIQKMMELSPDRIYYTHFGMVSPAKERLEEVIGWMPFFEEQCIQFFKEKRSVDQLEAFIKEAVYERLEKDGVPRDSSALDIIALDLQLNAQGVASYVKRLEKKMAEK